VCFERAVGFCAVGVTPEMKFITTIFLTALMAFAAVLPISAQALNSRSRQDKVETSKPAKTTSKPVAAVNQIRFASLESFSDGAGSFIRWNMEFEAGNLGFFIYRIDNNGKTLINESLIGGSALSVNDQTLRGTQYKYFDAKGSVGSTYIVQSVLQDGTKIDSPAFSSAYIGDISQIAGSDNARKSGTQDLTGSDSEQLIPNLSKEVISQVEDNQLAADPVNHKWVIQQPGVRIGVRGQGMYRVTSAELSAGGFNMSSDPANWRLYKDGVEQAINIGPSASYIEFYGSGLDRIETDEQMYYLIEGPSPGKRMQSRVMRRIGPGVVTPNYDATLTFKERTSYVNAILNGSASNFWGRVVFSSATTIPFNLTGIDRSRAEVSMVIFMQGYSFSAHSISVALNGTPIGTMTAFGRTPYGSTFTIPTSLLQDGSNGLTLQSSSSADTNLFDQFSLDFSRKYIAANGQLAFYTDNYRGVKLSGFSSSNVRVLDLTYDGSPQFLTNLQFTDDGGNFGTSMPPYRARKLYAFEDSALLTASSISTFDPSLLATPKIEGSLIIISYKDFMSEAETWANYRRDQGFSVKVVNVDEIYDEFNYGAAGSDAVTAFLHYAYDNWAAPPQYVLLMGDASYDPRGFEGIGRFNLIPTKFVNTIFSETGSDEAMADFNNDGFAEIAIGRIPARTVGIATHTLNKVMSFETPAMQSLSRGVLMAHDLNDGWDFDQMSVRVASELPEGTPVTYISRASPTAQADIITNINQGKYLVNYTGHGSSGAWAAVSFFSVLNEPQLTNTDQSLFTMLTCLNGYFVGNQNDSFSEVLVKSDHGAVAAWASAGLTTQDVQEVMAKRFFNQIGQGNITRMGDLIKDAKSVIPGGTDVRLSWVLIGDPMLKVR